MKRKISKTYEPQKYENKIYKFWEKSGFFNPDNLKLPKNSKPYTIILPPPNITDKLHLGHSSVLAIEDLLIRFHRMKGYRTLWLPGTDHAAIATQNAVEKKLLKEKDITRHQLGKTEFLKEVWKFLRQTRTIILKQTKRMGASLDWSRIAFTLDDQRKKAVKKMFCDMYKEGIIYQGERIVNWCPRCHSTLADDELEYQKQKTKLYTFKYSPDFPITIATTRPETKLGDTAVAVNPKDKRYKKFIGKSYKVNFLNIPLKIKIITDRQVDMNFGTGALGVTPAHSLTDWKMAEENKLNIVKVINEDGKVKTGFGEFSGNSISQARKRIVSKLKKQKLLKKEEDISHNIALCYRCGTTIETLPSKQWFVAVDKKIKRLSNKSLKEKALELAEKKEIKFIPTRFTKRYLDWINNLHDWCISRQIWFGHKIPVWYKDKKIYVGENPPKGRGWTQDPDTLDTWFSSGMWTFSTLGWPDNFKNKKKFGDLARFHPTQVLETGSDILTLWVSRMIIMTVFALQEIPFENVYLNGLVLDKFGKKMSKSKGNGIDPIDMANFFGADAVRLSLLIGSTPGNDLRVSEENIKSSRNFVTKLWNIYRYGVTTYPHFKLEEKISPKNIKTLSDCWILSRLNSVIDEVTNNLKNYKFSLAGEKLQNFTWNELADWYLEIEKIEKNDYVLGYVLDKILKLWHPFMPFATEHIWQSFYAGKKILMVEKWPQTSNKLIDKKAEKEFQNLRNIIVKIRNLRTSYKIAPQNIIKAFGEKTNNQKIIEKLSRIKINAWPKVRKKGIKISEKNLKLTLDIANFVNIEKERVRLMKEISNWKKIIKKNETLLANKDFLKNAPKDIITQNKKHLKEYKEKLKVQKELLKNLNF